MKKFIMFLFCMTILMSFLEAQIARDKVVIEAGTGTW